MKLAIATSEYSAAHDELRDHEAVFPEYFPRVYIYNKRLNKVYSGFLVWLAPIFVLRNENDKGLPDEYSLPLSEYKVLL